MLEVGGLNPALPIHRLDLIEDMSVNDIIDSTTGLPLIFPDSATEAYARAQEFRRLSPEERWKEITGLMEIGLNMVRNSPRRVEIEQRMEAQEHEWQRLQRKVFSQYGP
jgi:hypothetical protein